jgi:hypothetical protein
MCLFQIGSQVGTDQYLACMLILANLLNTSPAVSEMLPASELAAVDLARKHVLVMLNRYLKLKFGPKKASSKVRSRYYYDKGALQWLRVPIYHGVMLFMSTHVLLHL